MKARFDVKQPPVRVVENNDVAYVFICLNEEEKEETITYTTYPDEPEDVNDDVDPGFSVDPIPDDDIDADFSQDAGTDEETGLETDNETDNVEVIELEEVSEDNDETEDSEDDSGITINTVTITYYEYDYNEFFDKKNNLDLEDIQAHPENYLDYSPSQKDEEDILEENLNSLKAQFDEMKEAIERGLVV